MSKEINLYKSNRRELVSLTNEAHFELSKGWSFSYVYFLRELRDIYLIISKCKIVNKSIILKKCIEERVLPEGNNCEWTERNILERINALINFGLISKDGEILNKNIFNSSIGSELTTEDKNVFKKIFFKYFRFREIISWMIEPSVENRLELMSLVDEDYVIENSRVIFPFISEGRFVNSFFFDLSDNADVFYIDVKNSDLMRFWDVFVKWGVSLDLLDRFQLKWADVSVLPQVKSLSCVYFTRKIQDNFSVIEFISNNYKSNYIYIPQLVLDIVMSYRFSISDIKNLIIVQSIDNRDKISMQRTSEIFIEEKEKVLLPKHRNTYVSHLLIL